MNEARTILINTRDALQKQIDEINTTLKNITHTYSCLSCNKTFDNHQQFIKHNNSKVHFRKLGIEATGTKCSFCQNTFYGNHITLHVEDGRCGKSRTCNLCGKKCNNMVDTRISQPDKDDNDLSICEKVDRNNKTNLIPLDEINENDTYTSIHKHYNRNDVNYLPNSIYKLFLENEKLSLERSIDELVEHPSNLIYIYEPILVL